MKTQFNKEELYMLEKLLSELIEMQLNAGCNDLILDADANAKAFMTCFNEQVEEFNRLEYADGKIYGMDLSVTSYFIGKVRKLRESE